MNKKLSFIQPNEVVIDFDWYDNEIILANFDGVSYTNFRLIPGNWRDAYKTPTINHLRRELHTAAKNFGNKHRTIAYEAHATLGLDTDTASMYWANMPKTLS
jgi:hypothetical protein